MMKNKLCLLCFLFLLITLLSSCSEEVYKDSPVIGKWKNTVISPDDVVLTNTLIFSPNGKFSYICESSIKNEPQETQIGDGNFTINDTEINLTYDQVSGSMIIPKGVSDEEFMGIFKTGTITYNYRFLENGNLRIRRNENGVGHPYRMTYKKVN